jgi:hypothetical protein
MPLATSNAMRARLHPSTNPPAYQRCTWPGRGSTGERLKAQGLLVPPIPIAVPFNSLEKIAWPHSHPVSTS